MPMAFSTEANTRPYTRLEHREPLRPVRRNACFGGYPAVVWRESTMFMPSEKEPTKLSAVRMKEFFTELATSTLVKPEKKTELLDILLKLLYRSPRTMTSPECFWSYLKTNEGKRLFSNYMNIECFQFDLERLQNQEKFCSFGASRRRKLRPEIRNQIESVRNPSPASKIGSYWTPYLMGVLFRHIARARLEAGFIGLSTTLNGSTGPEKFWITISSDQVKILIQKFPTPESDRSELAVIPEDQWEQQGDICISIASAINGEPEGQPTIWHDGEGSDTILSSENGSENKIFIFGKELAIPRQIILQIIDGHSAVSELVAVCFQEKLKSLRSELSQSQFRTAFIGLAAIYDRTRNPQVREVPSRVVKQDFVAPTDKHDVRVPGSYARFVSSNGTARTR